MRSTKLTACVRLLLPIALGLAAACDAAPERAPRRPGGSGATLIGSVRLSVGAQLPEYELADLERRPRDAPESIERAAACADADTLGRRPVTLSKERGLGGIVIAASGFTSFAEREPIAHRVRIDDCLLSPATVAAMDGDSLIVENSAPFPLQPVFGVRVEAQTLRSGETRKYPLIGGGIESVMCTAPARCGRSDVVIFHHPVYAVTDEGGAFRIENFPTGMPVYVTAWHPLFAETATALWLEPGEEQRADLTLEPRAAADR